MLKINKIKCLHCGDIIVGKESQIIECSCGSCGAGGGKNLMKRKGKPGIDYKELSQWDEKYFGGVKEDVAKKPPGNDEAFEQLKKEHR